MHECPRCGTPCDCESGEVTAPESNEGCNCACDYDESFGDGFCTECGEPFHLDDTGGYNPPCRCGAHCRGCHEEFERGDSDDDDVLEEGDNDRT